MINMYRRRVGKQAHMTIRLDSRPIHMAGMLMASVISLLASSLGRKPSSAQEQINVLYMRQTSLACYHRSAVYSQKAYYKSTD